jgi:hypothetical protein
LLTQELQNVSKEKKSRKTRTPNVPIYTGPVPLAEGETLTARPAKASKPSASASSSSSSLRALPRTEGITADYTHIVSDLRRIAMLAGGVLVVLVALAFIIK